MSTERDKRLKKNIKNGEKKIKTVLKNSRRSVDGVISQYSGLSNFSTNANVRKKLFTELSKEYKVLNSEVNKWVESEVLVTAENFWKYAKQDLPAGAIRGTFGAFSEKYVSDIIAQINPSTIDKQVAINAQIGGMMTSDIRAIRAAVSTTVSEGAVEGLTNPQLANRMLEKIKKTTGGFNFVDKSGRRWTADNYFGMLNRTLHANAARNAYIDAATKEAGFDLYVIEGGVTGSSVDNNNDPCDDWVSTKRILSMTGNSKGYPTYEDAVSAGVFHPNCVHFVRAIMKSEIPEVKEEQKEAKKQVETLPDE